jgi:hypothetical protein
MNSAQNKDRNFSDVFSTIYDKDQWTHGSGPGSIASFNKPYIQLLQTFIRDNNIKTIVDVGSGDFQTLRHVNFDGCEYRGFDVVESVVARCNQLYRTDNIQFSIMPQDWEELPEADLYLIKDVLIHLNNADAARLLETSLTRCRYLMSTNDRVPDAESYNVDISTGQFRAVNISLAPFSIPSHVALAYGSARIEDPRYPYLVARLLKKFVWPGEKHVQIACGRR